MWSNMCPDMRPDVLILPGLTYIWGEFGCAGRPDQINRVWMKKDVLWEGLGLSLGDAVIT